MVQLAKSLISSEAAAVVENPAGNSAVLLICEHAGQQLPELIGSLGIDDNTMSTHIAWDLGAAELSRLLSGLLDAPLVMQRYSRLVYDCNRNLDQADAIVDEADDVVIPGNKGLSDLQRRHRYDAVYHPFYQAIEAILEDRIQCGLQTVIVTVHSFTPVYKGQQRTVDLGVLHDSDSRLADAVLLQAQQEGGYRAERNQPYSAQDGVTHTLITHGIEHGLLNIMLEIRNDLLADAGNRKLWALRLANLLSAALAAESVLTEVS